MDKCRIGDLVKLKYTIRSDDGYLYIPKGTLGIVREVHDHTYVLLWNASVEFLDIDVIEDEPLVGVDWCEIEFVQSGTVSEAAE